MQFGYYKDIDYILDLIEDNTGGLVNLVQADYGSGNGEANGGDVVGTGQEEDIIVVDTLRLIRGIYSSVLLGLPVAL